MGGVPIDALTRIGWGDSFQVERKHFDLSIESRNSGFVLIVSESGKYYRSSVVMEGEEVCWWVGVWRDFWYEKGENPWKRRRQTLDREVEMALGRNPAGRFLRLSVTSGSPRRTIFIPEGREAGGWWRLKAAVSKIAKRFWGSEVVTPDGSGGENKELAGASIPRSASAVRASSSSTIACPCCRLVLSITVEAVRQAARCRSVAAKGSVKESTKMLVERVWAQPGPYQASGPKSGLPLGVESSTKWTTAASSGQVYKAQLKYFGQIVSH